MNKHHFLFVCLATIAILFMACNRPSKAEQYRAEKHVKDSIALCEQQRSLTYYQSQLDALNPQVDSLLALFSYERNEKYQDHGYYVVKNSAIKGLYTGIRIMVRDDGQDLVAYRNGKRVPESADNFKGKEQDALTRAQHLQVLITDINQLEQRIRKTSLEVQKYQKRLQK